MVGGLIVVAAQSFLLRREAAGWPKSEAGKMNVMDEEPMVPQTFLYGEMTCVGVRVLVLVQRGTRETLSPSRARPPKRGR